MHGRRNDVPRWRNLMAKLIGDLRDDVRQHVQLGRERLRGVEDRDYHDADPFRRLISPTTSAPIGVRCWPALVSWAPIKCTSAGSATANPPTIVNAVWAHAGKEIRFIVVLRCRNSSRCLPRPRPQTYVLPS